MRFTALPEPLGSLNSAVSGESETAPVAISWSATPKILIIVPAFNEAENIETVVADLRAHLGDVVVAVVDDGSADSTTEVARGAGARVLRLPFNLGIGGAVQTGLQYACEGDFDIAVQFDGDGQHLASELAKLIAPILSDEADMVIGSRFVGPMSHRSSALRRVGIRTFSVLAWMLTGNRIQDVTSGFRAYNRTSVSFLAQHYPTHYPEPEAIIWASRRKLRLTEVPAMMRERQHGSSSITLWKSLYYVLRVSLGMVITAFRDNTTRGGM